MYLNKILVTTDFSEAAAGAYVTARQEAKKSHSELTLVHVIEPPILAADFDGYAPPANFFLEVEQGLEAQARKNIQQVVETYFSDLAPTTIVLKRSASTAEVISRYAEENGIGLIVIAAHGRGLFGRALLGSTTESIIRKAPCPVLVVPKESEEILPAHGSYDRILVTTDFSPESLVAFKYAAYEAKLNGAKVTVGHVQENLISPELLNSSKLTTSVNVEAEQARYIAAVDHKLQECIKEHFPLHEAGARIIEKTYSVANSIVEFARSRNCDLIVMAARGRGRSWQMIGGVAERVLRDTPCPVLMVPERK